MTYPKYIFSLLFFINNIVFAQELNLHKRKNLEIVTKNEKQGVFNTKTKRFVIKPVYDYIHLDEEAIGKYNCGEKTKIRSIIIDSSYIVYDISNSNIPNSYEYAYAIVNNSKNLKGIYNYRTGLFVTKVEFDSILFINVFVPDFEQPHYTHSSLKQNFKPNQDLYAILGKNNKYHLLNVEQNSIDTSAYIIYIKRNDEAFDRGDYRYKKDSKFQVINLPDSNYEFDSTFYLFNSTKVNAINTDIVKHYKKYGLYTYDEGKFYLPIEYDSIIQEKNYYKTFKDGKLGYARRFSAREHFAGEVPSNYTYTIITGDSNFEKIVDFDKQVYRVKINGKWGFRNFNDQNKYDSIYLTDRKLLLKKDGKWSINKTKDFDAIRRYKTAFVLPRNLTKRRINKVWKDNLDGIYDYQTHFIWDSIAIINENYYLAKLDNNFLILNSLGFTQIQLKPKKVMEVGIEKMHNLYVYYLSEEINGQYKVIKKQQDREFGFVTILIRKNPLFKKPYNLKMYLQGNKLVRQLNFKKSKYALLRNYLRACFKARQENRKMKK